jgi:ATP-dependent RNA helicase DDX51/DBP6
MGSRKRRAPSPADEEPAAASDGEGNGDEAAVAAFPAPAAPPSKGRAPAALAWMRDARTLDDESDAELNAAGVALDARLVAALQASGIQRLFAVQAAVLRTLHGGRGAHDLCIHAPTGSGKTLAYALPVVAALTGRVIRRLRALVVLPTHDLAQQARAAHLAARTLCLTCLRAGGGCLPAAVPGGGPGRRRGLRERAAER